jgi:tRNA 2-thiouridine synthesizing protein A
MPDKLVDERWDAGEMGCGQLVFELQRRLKAMRPGESIEVIARSPGAPVDLPAWCRMTGHALLSVEPPVYVIRKGA